MDKLNLNSDNYSIEEIEKLFNLHKPYVFTDINNAKKTLVEQIKGNNSLGIEKQNNILFFIDTIATRISNKILSINQPNNGDNPPTIFDTTLIEQGSNFIIQSPSRVDGRYSKFEDGRVTAGSTEAPSGFMNPLNVRTITQAVSIDSRFRPNYYNTKSTNFDMTLPALIKNVVSLRVATIELPMTYYAISKSYGNNNFLIVSQNTLTNYAWNVILPDGNYEQSWANESKAFHIETAINNALSTAIPGTWDGTTFTPDPLTPNLNPKNDICFTIDRISGRGVFATPNGSTDSPLIGGFVIYFNVDPDGNLDVNSPIQLRLGWQLGFRAAKYFSGNFLEGTFGAAVSEGICLVCGPRYGFISINDYQKNTGPPYIVAYGSSIFQDNIITRINLAALQGDVGVYQISSDPGLTTQMNRTREYFGPVDIQKLHIALYDEFGRIIDLNNMDWSLTLAFEVLYV